MVTMLSDSKATPQAWCAACAGAVMNMVNILCRYGHFDFLLIGA